MRCRTCCRLLRGRDLQVSRLLGIVGVRPYCHRCRRHYEADLLNLTRVARGPDTPFRLQTLLAGVVPENRHGEVDWGQPVGREVW